MKYTRERIKQTKRLLSVYTRIIAMYMHVFVCACFRDVVELFCNIVLHVMNMDSIMHLHVGKLPVTKDASGHVSRSNGKPYLFIRDVKYILYFVSSF